MPYISFRYPGNETMLPYKNHITVDGQGHGSITHIPFKIKSGHHDVVVHAPSGEKWGFRYDFGQRTEMVLNITIDADQNITGAACEVFELTSTQEYHHSVSSRKFK